MEDILDIYEPVYRENSLLLPVIIVLSVLILLSVVLVFIYFKKRIKKHLTHDEIYAMYMDKYTDLKKSIVQISSYDFANKVNSYLKGFITELYKKDYYHATIEELITYMESFNISMLNDFKNIYLEHLQPAMYGNVAISKEDKDSIIVNCVEITTQLYNKRVDDNV